MARRWPWGMCGSRILDYTVHFDVLNRRLLGWLDGGGGGVECDAGALVDER
jgi:hypothetical protein